MIVLLLKNNSQTLINLQSLQLAMPLPVTVIADAHGAKGGRHMHAVVGCPLGLLQSGPLLRHVPAAVVVAKAEGTAAHVAAATGAVATAAVLDAAAVAVDALFAKA